MSARVEPGGPLAPGRAIVVGRGLDIRERPPHDRTAAAVGRGGVTRFDRAVRNGSLRGGCRGGGARLETGGGLSRFSGPSESRWNRGLSGPPAGWCKSRLCRPLRPT